MTNIIFIRHAPAIIDRSKLAKEWTLADNSQRLCRTLAQRIKHYQVKHLYTSSEDKAILTGQYITETLQLENPKICPNLEETASRRFYESQAEFRETVIRAMQHPDELIFGDEIFKDAKARISEQVQRLAQQHPDETIAIVTHGRILSMYLGDKMQETPETIWKRLQMPAYAVLSWDSQIIIEMSYTVEIA